MSNDSNEKKFKDTSEQSVPKSAAEVKSDSDSEDDGDPKQVYIAMELDLYRKRPMGHVGKAMLSPVEVIGQFSTHDEAIEALLSEINEGNRKFKKRAMEVIAGTKDVAYLKSKCPYVETFELHKTPEDDRPWEAILLVRMVCGLQYIVVSGFAFPPMTVKT